MKNHLEQQLALKKFKILYEYSDPGKTVKILNTMNLQKIRKKMGQMFCLPHAFLSPAPNQDLDKNLLALTNFLTWLRLGSPLIIHVHHYR